MTPRRVAVLAILLVAAGCGGGEQQPSEGTADDTIIATKSDFTLYRVDPKTGKSVRLQTGRGAAEAEAHESEPACAADEGQIAFVRETIGRTELRLLDLDRGESRVLRRLDAGFASPALAPDGRRVAYAETAFGLRLLDIETGRVEVLTRGFDQHPTWSPDGKRLAFEHDATGNGDTSIWTMAADGEDRRQLIRPRGEDIDHKPEWSPDGTLIAFERPYDVWVADTRTGEDRLVVRIAELLAWSPDSQSLLVQEFRKMGMYAVPVDGAVEPRLIADGLWFEACWVG